jgi:hypothetical protein
MAHVLRQGRAIGDQSRVPRHHRSQAAAATASKSSATKPHGTFGYAAGTATGVVDVPANALLTAHQRGQQREHASTTVQIGLGAVITLPLGVDLDIPIVGDALNADVTIGGGAPQVYFVSWVVAA